MPPITFNEPPIFTFFDIPAPPKITSAPEETLFDWILDVILLCSILNVPRQIKFPPTPIVKLPLFPMTMLLLWILLCNVPFTVVFPETVRLLLVTILPPQNKFPAILAPPKDTSEPCPSCDVSVLSVKMILPRVN